MTAGPWVRGILSGLVTVVAVAVVGLGVLAWDRFAGDDRPDQRRPAVQSQDALTCTNAQPTLFAALSAHLARKSDAFSSRQFVVDDDGLQYLSAAVGDGKGSLRATDPVWVYGGSGYAWLNESAHRLSSGLPDARAAYGSDPAGPAASRVITCATSSNG
ncbi:hypothetical protein [Pseudonocardia endophytica]|uniref:Uncharacterized protein n=1 Tax=Pseudonocardia endophytica TaxID=401976 RepID=A0A4R1I0U3_PSEEN|nr:hypothetical protein [Pseudonocardia endophytica]TCK27503.1 hypothetical protein EV378_3375 [Pseudonocardia endophytica]